MAADLAPNRLDLRGAVDDPEPPRFFRRKTQVSFPDSSVKYLFLPLETVLRRLGSYASRPLFGPFQTGLNGEIEQQRKVRFERTCGKVVQRADERGVKPPAETLVGHCRVRKAVAEDPLPRFQ